MFVRLDYVRSSAVVLTCALLRNRSSGVSMRVTVRLFAVFVLLSLSPIAASSAPVTLRFTGTIDGVVRPEDSGFPPEETSWWTDLSALTEGMPWQLTVTYDAEFVGNQLVEPADPTVWGGIWLYDDAVTAASF